jgi:hypothetical protein
LGEQRNTIGAPLAENLLYFLLWWRDDIPVRTPADLGYPLSRHFQARGLASLRTGWGPDDWLVSHYCGRREHACHRQGDHNHVSFYALGEWFLVDAGYGDQGQQEDTTAPVNRWFGETDAHNCVLVDGANQRGPAYTPGWSEGELLDFRHTPAFDTTLGDASSCTGPDHRIRQSHRRVVVVRHGPAPYVAIVDVNEKDGTPFLAEHLWHTAEGNHLDLVSDAAGGPASGNAPGSALRFVLRGQAAQCDGHVLWPAAARLSVGDSHGRPQLRVAVHAPVAEAVTVFCPRRPGDAAPSFTCERIAPATFRITCALGGQTSTLDLSAATEGPLHDPLPTQFTTFGGQSEHAISSEPRA